jgi:hypothetical protein
VTVVVIVAGDGVAVVVLQPDQVPVQLENGPQPPVHVVQASQFMPLALVPHGPLPPPKPPGPPGPPWPPNPPWPPHGPLPGPQPEGAPGRAVEQAETQDDHALDPQPPLGPQPEGPAVICERVPPDVAEKVACCELVTVTPLLAHS